VSEPEPPAGDAGSQQGLSVAHEVPVNGFEILDKVLALPISAWSYTFDDPSVRHIGPMAQDWAAAFGLGDTDRMIDMVDANGITLVCIQALHRRIAELQEEVTRLRDRLDDGDHAPPR